MSEILLPKVESDKVQVLRVVVQLNQEVSPVHLGVGPLNKRSVAVVRLAVDDLDNVAAWLAVLGPGSGFSFLEIVLGDSGQAAVLLFGPAPAPGRRCGIRIAPRAHLQKKSGHTSAS